MTPLNPAADGYESRNFDGYFNPLKEVQIFARDWSKLRTTIRDTITGRFRRYVPVIERIHRPEIELFSFSSPLDSSESP